MLSAGVESLEKRHFDAFSSSMSAVVQELYAGLPAALSAECPVRVLGANPEAFVLSCGGLPSEHQRTHGIRPSNSPERPDRTSKISRPGLMDPVTEEAGGPARGDGSAVKWDSLSVSPRGAADISEEDAVPFPLGVEEQTRGSKEEEMLLTQPRGESCPSLPCVETAAVLQILEEDEAKEQVTPENLSDSRVQPQADGAAPFRTTREQSSSAPVSVTLEQRSAVDAIMAKITVPGTNTLPFPDPLSFAGDAVTIGQLHQENESILTYDGTFSAAGDVFSSSEAGGEKSLNEGFNTLCPPAQRNEIALRENITSTPVLGSKISVDAWLSDMNPETSVPIRGSNLTFENVLWEESTDPFEVVCETQEADQFSDNESVEIELLEEWTSPPKMETSQSPMRSCEDLYYECENEMDHSYSCVYKEDVPTHNETAPHHSSGKKTHENDHLGENKVTVANGVILENGSSPFHDLVLPPAGEESTILGTEDINDRRSLSPRDDRLDTSAKENHAFSVEASDFGCFQHSCNVSVDTYSPYPDDSLDYNPEPGEGGLSQTVSACNQATEILKAFPVVDPPAANASAINITSVSREEHPETTQVINEVLFTQKTMPAVSDPLSVESNGEHPGTKSLLASQNGGGNEGGEARHGTEVMPRDRKKREDDAEDVQSDARGPSDPCVNDLCSVLEACLLSPKVRTGTNSEDSDGKETRNSSASNREAVSPHACGGDLDRNASNSAPLAEASNSGPLKDETENQRSIVDDTLVKSEGIMGVKSRVFTPSINPEQKLTEDSFTVGCDGAETIEASQINQINGDSASILHPVELGSLVKDQSEGGEEERCHALPPCSFSAADVSCSKADLNPDSLGCVEQRERSLISEDLCSKDAGQRGGTVGPMETQPLVKSNYCVDNPILFDEKDKASNVEIQGCSSLPVMSSEKQKVNVVCIAEETQKRFPKEQQVSDVTQTLVHKAGETPQKCVPKEQQEDGVTQTLVCTAEETQKSVSEEEQVDDVTQTTVFLAEETQTFASCAQNASTHIIGDQSLMSSLPAPVLLMESGVQETFRKSGVGDSSSDETVSKLNRNSPKEASAQPKTVQHCLESSELASKPLKLNGFVHDQALEAKMDESCVFSDRLDKNQFPKISSTALSPSRKLLQPKPVTFNTSDIQESMDGVHCDSHEEKETLGLAGMHLVAQPLPNSEISQKDEPFIAPSSETLSSLVPVLFDRETNDLVDWQASENKGGNRTIKEETHVDSPLGCDEIPVSSVAGKERKGEIESLICNGSDPSLVERSSENVPREITPTVEKMELPIPSSSDTSDASRSPVRDSTFTAGEEKTTFPIEVETQMRLPQENTPELGFSIPPNPSETVMVRHRPEDANSALQTEGLFPGNSPEILSRIGGGLLKVSPQCPNHEGRYSPVVEDRREVAGDRTKPSAGQPVITEAPVNTARPFEVGDCPELTQKRKEKETPALDAVSQEERTKKKVKAKGLLKRRRVFEIERPLVPFSNETVMKPARQTLAVGGVVDNTDNRTLRGDWREPKRPKRSEGLIRVEPAEAESLVLCSNNSHRLSCDLLAFCTSPQAVALSRGRSRGAYESPRSTRKPLIFRRQIGKSGLKIPMPCRFKAPKRPPSAFLRSSSESSPRRGCKLTSPAHIPSAQNTKVTIWEQPPKQTSLLLDVFRPSKHAKEPALLRKLSTLADKLLAPQKNPRRFKPLWNPPTPEKYSQFQSKTLQELFSSVEAKLNSPWVNPTGRCDFKKVPSPSFSLHPLESASLCILELSGKNPFTFSALAFPAPFHVKTDPVLARNVSGMKSLQSVSHRPAWREAQAQPPFEWTFSFLFSQNVALSKEACVLTPPPCARKDSRYTIAHNAYGLQTVLALFSPGCWRLWARKRRLPPIQRLSFLRFTGALKDSNFPSTEIFSSLPSTLDGGLPAWRRLDSPSMPPSEISPRCSPRCAWRQEATTTTSLPWQLRWGLQNSSAMFPPAPDQSLDVPVALKEDVRWETSFSASIPSSLSIPEPTWSRLGLSAPEFPVRPLDELNVPVLAFPPRNAQREDAELEKKPKKVSQIRIRKTIPKPDPNLTPMGLPRPKRLKKTEFSLEEIYTNKNYKSPPATRSLETIFEEPKEKNGSLISISHQKRKRILEFQDFTIPRKRRARSRVKVTGGFTRAQKAALEGRELDVLLLQRLTDLETFFAEQEELGGTPGS